jgi:CubicO group peptidase (beta-lactamase class C family)
MIQRSCDHTTRNQYLRSKQLSMNPFVIFFLCVFSAFQLVAQKEITADTANIAKLIEFSKNTYTDEILVLSGDQVICHWKNNDCDSVLFNTASMVKSWTGLAVGILVDKGLIASEEDLVCTYLPEWKAGCDHQVTIKNLLTMTAGINRQRGAQSIMAVEDMHQYALDVTPDTFPNIKFSYSNESVQLLGLIIESVSGKTANEFFREVLFNPLDMNNSRLGQDPNGNDVVFGGALTTINDASKIALLMANEGKYKGNQIVSESWINKSVSPSEHASFYGYLWWLDYNSEHKNFAATGDFGQLTIIYPELDLIFLRQQSCNKEISGNMTWMGPDFLKLIPSVIRYD